MESPFREPVPAGTCLIETFRFRAMSQSVERRLLHRARLERSAQAFGIEVDHDEIRAKLQAIECDAELRCRLTLAMDGTVEIVAAPMPVVAEGTWTLAISDQRLRSDDPWLRYKTTNRALYDDTRANLPKSVDEVLFLNERDEVCEGTITNVFVEQSDGTLLTPPLSCGLLPGVLRESLLAEGRAREAVIDMGLLQSAKRLHVGNSLRGLIPARLTS